MPEMTVTFPAHGANAAQPAADTAGSNRPQAATAMTPDFTSVHNHYEHPVFAAIAQQTGTYPLVSSDALADVACVALNRLGPRYIRHSVDLTFYMSEKDRLEMERSIAESVTFAFEYVQARVAMRARR
jgi:hypothetical protein